MTYWLGQNSVWDIGRKFQRQKPNANAFRLMSALGIILHSKGLLRKHWILLISTRLHKCEQIQNLILRKRDEQTHWHRGHI